MSNNRSWLDKRSEPIKQKCREWGQAFEQKMMASQWHSAAADLASFAFEPLWGNKEMPARIEAIEKEPQVTHLWLRPAQRWAWPRAGQFVTVTVEYQAELTSRCYSISGTDLKKDLVRLSICKVENGMFSTQIAPQLAAGDVIKISAASGDFVLPKAATPLWLCAAGSGITPMLPLAQAALEAGQPVQLFALQREDKPILWQQWLTLQQRYPSLLRCELWNSRQQGRPSETDLSERLKGMPAAVQVFVCGNEGFRNVVQQAAESAALPMAQLRMESFYQTVTAPRLTDSSEIVAKVNLSDGRAIPVREGETILQAAQAAGVAMQHCCGRGVCRSCETRKISGVVENIQTGLKQLRDGEWILPCVSLPTGTVELAV